MSAWDFSKLPEHEHHAVISAYNSGNIRGLIAIHDQYELSPHSYCCDHHGLLAWFGDAIKNGTINGQKQNNKVAGRMD